MNEKKTLTLNRTPRPAGESGEKRPTLTLKRRPATEQAVVDPVASTEPVVRRRKQVVVVSTPAWKVKKQQLEREKEAAAAAEAATQQVAAPLIADVAPAKTPPPVRWLKLLPPEQAVKTLKAFWPQLFDNNSPRLLVTGMREQLFADIAARDLPLSHKQVIKCLKSLTRSAGYLSRMREGASRYDLQGNVVATVTTEEARYASERMMQELLRTERMRSHTAD